MPKTILFVSSVGSTSIWKALHTCNDSLLDKSVNSNFSNSNYTILVISAIANHRGICIIRGCY